MVGLYGDAVADLELVDGLENCKALAGGANANFLEAVVVERDKDVSSDAMFSKLVAILRESKRFEEDVHILL